MSQIEWRANSNQQLVAFENSKSLADFANPEAQAQAWVEQLKFDSACESICVIGLGSGFHIDALTKKFKGQKIFVIDSRPALLGFFAKKFKNVDFVYAETTEDLKKLDCIQYLMSAHVQKVCFDPAFGMQSESLEEVFWFLNVRTYEGLSYHLKWEVPGKPHVLINAKQFLETVGVDYSEYRNSEVLTIRELIR